MVLAQYGCDPELLKSAVSSFHRKHILVVGDVMLDRFIWGSVSRISPEAPVPVVEIRTETTCLGGAGNVVANIHSLGGIPVPVGVIGDDFEGRRLLEELRRLSVPLGGIVIDPGRPTSVKTRIIAHNQQVCRTDREDRNPIEPRVQALVREKFRRFLRPCHAIVVSDYAKGLLTPRLLRGILPLARSARKIVCVDPKVKNLAVYRSAVVITPNTAETEQASGITISGKRELARAGKKVLEQTGIRHLLVTRGEEGMALFERDTPRVTYIPTVAREVFDVTGAGDTVISTLTLGLAAGLTMLQAAMLSNIAAGIVVGKLGTAAVNPDELIARIESMAS